MVLIGIAALEPLVDPDIHLNGRVELWIAAFVIFALAFHIGASASEGPAQRGRKLAALGVQTAALLAMAALLPCQSGALMLVVAASQGALVLQPRTVLVWIALQTASVAYFFLPSCQLPAGLATVMGLLGFQGFAAVAIHLARREAESRTALARTNAELVATRALLEEASRANERTRIARDLHDVLGHDLTALGLQLEIATHVDGDAGRTHLTKAQQVNARLLRNVRDVVGAMRAEVGPDLVSALRTLVADVPGMTVHLDSPDVLVVDDPARAQCVVRCVQEIVTNALPPRAGAQPLDPRRARGGPHHGGRARRRARGGDALRGPWSDRDAGTSGGDGWSAGDRDGARAGLLGDGATAAARGDGFVIRVVLVEDHTLVREGIRTLLGLVPDIALAGEAADGEEAVRVAVETQPDVLLLDMRMPRGDGTFVVEELARRGILPPTLILTTFGTTRRPPSASSLRVRGGSCSRTSSSSASSTPCGLWPPGARCSDQGSRSAPSARSSSATRRARRRPTRRSPRASARCSACSPPGTRTARSRGPSSSPRGP